MITAADYSEWTYLAGLYLGNVSKAERYQTFQKKISDAGLVSTIIIDFLDGNPGGIDVAAWRSNEVYEMGHDAAWRVEQTAKALEAIGAKKTAAKARTAKDMSIGAQLFGMAQGGAGMPEIMEQMKSVDIAAMMDQLRKNVARAFPDAAARAGIPPPESKPVPVDSEVESKEQIEYLLEQFVKSHQTALQSDYQKHGDPRQQPGYSLEDRERELKAMRDREWDVSRQREQSAELQEVLDQMRTQLENDPQTPAKKINQARKRILEGYKAYSRRPADELLPEMQKWLDRAGRFMSQQVAIFHPTPIDDPELLRRLGEIGTYEVDLRAKRVSVAWDTPNGFDCDWTTFALRIEFPKNGQCELSRLLEQIAHLRTDWLKHQVRLRAEVIASFNNYFDQMGDWELEDYELGPDGHPTDASILSHCERGMITLAPDFSGDVPGEEGIVVYFGVDWDDEHGLELFL